MEIVQKRKNKKMTKNRLLKTFLFISEKEDNMKTSCLNKSVGRFLAMILSIAMVFGNVPMTTYAQEAESVSANTLQSTVSGNGDQIVEEKTVSENTVSQNKIMLTSLEPVVSENALTEDDFLKADGKNLRNQSGTGDIVNLRGTNAGGYLLQEFWMTPTTSTANINDEFEIYAYLQNKYGSDELYNIIDIYQDSYWTEADFDNCAAMGVNTIRLPFWYRNLVDENGNFYGYNAAESDPYKTAFARMDWFVQEAKERGIYVIIDFHGAPGSQNGSDHSGVDGGDEKELASEFFFGNKAASNQKLFYDIWEVIADRYAEEPAVAAYDLLNEPYCTYRYNSKLTSGAEELHDMLWNVYDIAYDKIRAKDANHVIIMEATWNPVDLPNPAVYGWSNIMYEYHNYLYDDYDNATGAQITNMQSKLNAIAISDYNVPSYMGEFSYFNNNDAWAEGLALLNDAGINWTTWTYKTVLEYGNWGLYNHTAEFNSGINLETASLDEIKTWYARMGEVQPNQGLVNVVSAALKAPVQENNMNPEYTTVPDGNYYLKTVDTEGIVKIDQNSVNSETTNKDSENNSHMFEVVNNGDKTISLKSAATNAYLSVSSDGKLNATATDITDLEKFYVFKLTQTTVALKSKSAQFFVSSTEKNGYVLSASASAAESTESFYFVDENDAVLGDDAIALHSGWTRIEAENATIVGGKTEAQDFYSNGLAAGDMVSGTAFADIASDFSNVRYVEFTAEAAKAGEYQLVINYNGDDDKNIAVKANNQEATQVYVPQKVGGSWNTPLQQLVTVNLEKGTNIIRITGAIEGKGWMNIDCIDISNAPISINNGVVRYEGEDFYFTGSAEGQFFYSNGIGVGNLNSATTLEKVLPSWNNIKFVEFTVYLEEAGNYNLKWAYNGAGSDGMTALYKVNDEEQQVLTLNNAGASWDKMTSTSFDVALNAGFNTIRISGTLENKDYWANVDYIELLSPGAIDPISGFAMYEAEKAIVVGGKAEAQDFYSSKKGIGSLVNDITAEEASADWSGLKYVTFKVDAPQTGDYRMIVAYNGDDDKKILAKVNDGENQIISVPAVLEGHNWDVLHTFELTVSLTKGSNTVSLSGAMKDGWINYDYAQIAKNEIKVIDADKGITRYEAEDFSFKSTKSDAAALEAQSFYSDGYCIGGVGGLVSLEEGADIIGSDASWINFTVYAEKAGQYNFTLAINGNGADIKSAYQINGNPSAYFTLKNAGHSWDQIGYGTFTADLQAGYNEVVVSGGLSETWDDWANYDYLDVEFVGLTAKAIEEQVYTGAQITPIPEVYSGETKLQYETDYTVSYENNVVAASADAKQAPTIIITGTGNYSGECKVTFSIVKRAIDQDYGDGLSVVADDIYVLKSDEKAQPVVKLHNETTGQANELTLNEDYTLEYSSEDVSAVGLYTVTINGIGNFEGNKLVKYTVVNPKKAVLDKAKVTLYLDNKKLSKVTYTGKAIEPTAVVTFGKEVVPAEAYDVVYENNIETGTAKVTVNAKDGSGYFGSKSATFKIVPVKNQTQDIWWQTIVKVGQAIGNFLKNLFS